MPMIEFANVPVLRRAVLRLRSIETMQRDQTQDSAALLDASHSSLSVLRDIDGMLRSLVARIEDATARDAAGLIKLRDELHQTIGALDRRSAQLEASLGRLETFAGPNVGQLMTELTRRLEVLIDLTSDEAPLATDESPDRALCSHLAPYLRSNRAMDIGAHRGTYTAALLDQGLEVVAVEPDESLADSLRQQLSSRSRVSVRQAAIAEQEGTATMYRAVDNTRQGRYGDTTLFTSLVKHDRVNGMSFEEGFEVDTLTVQTLRDELSWPPDIGLVKVDVEGAGLRVLAGFGDTRPEILTLEYWGPEHVLATEASGDNPAELIDAALGLGFRRWVTIIHHEDRVTFAVNNRTVPPSSWGNMVFLDDREAFMAAIHWCEAVLTREVRG